MIAKTSKSKLKFDRRALLKGLGLSPALLPILESDEVFAQTGLKRFLAFVWPNGVTRDFWPGAEGTELRLTDVLSPLEPHKQDVSLVDGVDNRAMMDQYPRYGGHASLPYLLTGGRGKYHKAGEDLAIGDRISLDQHIANELQKKQALPVHSLVLGVDNREESKRPHKYISFTGPAIGDSPSAPPVQDDVHKTYAQLFGTGAPRGAGSGLDPEALARLRLERKSILDHVGRDLEAFGKRLGRDSKRRIESHLGAVRGIESQLDAMASGSAGSDVSTGAGARPTAPEAGFNTYAKENYDKILKLQIDMVVASFAAGQTRVATILASNGHNNSWVFRWLGGEFAQRGDGSFNPLRSHHEMAHRGGGGGAGDDARRKNTVDKWFISQLAYTMARFKAVSEGAGSMLDNSVILWMSNMGNGASHGNTRLPMLVAGKGGGYFKPGRIVKAGGKPHNGVLVAIGNAMGVPMGFFGDEKYGGEIAGLRGA